MLLGSGAVGLFIMAVAQTAAAADKHPADEAPSESRPVIGHKETAQNSLQADLEHDRKALEATTAALSEYQRAIVAVRDALVEYERIVDDSKAALTQYKAALQTASTETRRKSESTRDAKKAILGILAVGGLTVAAIFFGFFGLLVGTMPTIGDGSYPVYWEAAVTAGAGVLVSLFVSVSAVMALCLESGTWALVSIVCAGIGILLVVLVTVKSMKPLLSE